MASCPVGNGLFGLWGLHNSLDTALKPKILEDFALFLNPWALRSCGTVSGNGCSSLRPPPTLTFPCIRKFFQIRNVLLVNLRTLAAVRHLYLRLSSWNYRSLTCIPWFFIFWILSLDHILNFVIILKHQQFLCSSDLRFWQNWSCFLDTLRLSFLNGGNARSLFYGSHLFLTHVWSRLLFVEGCFLDIICRPIHIC